MMKTRHINIPIFIPHLGCPNDCVFCNQRYISGVKEFEADSVIPIIESSLQTMPNDADAEIAFFGGSFTGIDRDLMKKLLSIANSYLIQGRIKSIRCSTRPDYINDEVLRLLKEYGVKTIELGLQSTSDDVLSACHRGHSFSDTKKACIKIKEYGFALGCQMMIGLPGASPEDEAKTAEFITSIKADETRIYPTIVFKNTELCRMAENKAYIPLSIDEAVIRSAKVFEIFILGGVKVLRVGLCDSENLHSDSTYFAGPNHPAIGDLVEGEYYYNLIDRKLSDLNISKQCGLTIAVARGHTSRVVGQHKKNKIRLTKKYGFSSLSVTENEAIKEYDVLFDLEERK